jgi:hypothetical protein
LCRFNALLGETPVVLSETPLVFGEAPQFDMKNHHWCFETPLSSWSFEDVIVEFRRESGGS